MVFIDPFSSYLLRNAGSHGPVALMYHSISQGRGVTSWEWSLSCRYFQNHLDLLQDNGWKTACIRDIVNMDLLPKKTVFITFDDGYLDNYFAYEELSKREMVATWFIVTNDIGRNASWGDDEQKKRTILDDGKILEISDAGMEIGSHTCSHKDLTLLDEAGVDSEVRASKKTLEDLLGKRVHSFAYPYGKYNERVISSVEKVGYDFATSCRTGWIMNNYDRMLIRRLAIFNTDHSSILSRKLAFGDNDVGWGAVGKYLYGRIAKK